MKDTYNKIIAQIDAARKANDMKALRRANKRLEKWQANYGAYAPVK